MRRALAITLTSLTLAASGFGLAAYAEDSSSTAAPEAAKTDAPAIPADKATATTAPAAAKPAKRSPFRILHLTASPGTAPATAPGSTALPTRVAATAVGSFVGIPVSMVRKTRVEIGSATKDLIGDTNRKWLMVAVSPICIPAGMVSGFFQGFLYGPYNAWKYSNQPFSAETFSLGSSR